MCGHFKHTQHNERLSCLKALRNGRFLGWKDAYMQTGHGHQNIRKPDSISCAGHTKYQTGVFDSLNGPQASVNGYLDIVTTQILLVL